MRKQARKGWGFKIEKIFFGCCVHTTHRLLQQFITLHRNHSGLWLLNARMRALRNPPTGSQSPTEEPLLQEGFPPQASGVGNPPSGLSHRTQLAPPDFLLSKIRRRKRGRMRRAHAPRTPVVLVLLILLWSLAIGWGLSLATNAQPTTETASDAIGAVDSVPQRYQLGQELYLENCASCHIALPPAVLPTQTWQQLLQDSEHYGIQLQPLVDPPRLLVWNYLKTFSRLLAKEEQEMPYRVDDSRYFKALHPKVKLPRPVEITSCVSCHPGAAQYNFRRLTPEWENSQ